MMNSYRKLCAEFYDLDKPVGPPTALDFYGQYAAQACGPVLEPMCGTGRFLIPLLANGLDIEGADASPEMLAACRRNCARCGLQPVLWEQRLEQLELPRRYALIFIPAGSFCLITEWPAIRESLRRLQGALKPGGKLVMEIERVPARPASEDAWDGSAVIRPDGARIRLRGVQRYDPATRVKTCWHVYELVRDGQVEATENEELKIRHYTVAEFEEHLTQTGFTNVIILPGETPETFVVECQRPDRVT